MTTIMQTMECPKCGLEKEVEFTQMGWIDSKTLECPGVMWSDSDQEKMDKGEPIPLVSIVNMRDATCPSCYSFMRRK